MSTILAEMEKDRHRGRHSPLRRDVRDAVRRVKSAEAGGVRGRRPRVQPRGRRNAAARRSCSPSWLAETKRIKTGYTTDPSDADLLASTRNPVLENLLHHRVWTKLKAIVTRDPDGGAAARIHTTYQMDRREPAGCSSPTRNLQNIPIAPRRRRIREGLVGGAGYETL